MSIRITGMNSGLDTDSMVQELVNAYSKKTETMKKKQTKMEWKQEAWTSLNTKIKNFYSKSLEKMKYASNYNKKVTTVSDSTKASVVSSDSSVIGTQTLKISNLAKSTYLTGGEIKTTDKSKVTSSTTLGELGYEGDDVDITINRETGDPLNFTLTKDTKISDVVNYFDKAGYNANFDSSTGRLFVSSKTSGKDGDFNFNITTQAAQGAGESDEDYNSRIKNTKDTVNALSSLGLLKKEQIDASGITSDIENVSYASKIDGENAKIVLNGATFESNTNTFSVNGLTITAKELTGDNAISLNTEVDYDSIYNNIKDFIKEYNSLISELDKLYNADSAKDYEPLTSDEKESMSDEEVEKWEQKIKDSLLRRDENVNSVRNAMKDAMLSVIEVDGKKYSLSSFGINTLGYFEAADNEKSVYHIDGDEDDSSKSGEKDKLKSMLATNPEVTESFFKNLASKMYTSLNNLSRTSSYRSYGSFYDNKKMESEYDDYKTEISEYEDYVSEIEEKYYNQFTAMEKALAKVQSQKNYISQLAG